MEGKALWVSQPQSVGELLDSLKEAAEKGIDITVQGSRTGLAGGAVPAGGLALGLSKLKKSMEIKDGLLLASASVALGEAKVYLKRQRLVFAADPSEDEATLGGLFATGARGLKTEPFGRQVQELLWALPTGETLLARRGEACFDSTGIRIFNQSIKCPVPVKSRFPGVPFQGQDLIDFLSGSDGRLGIALNIKVKTFPKPKNSWAIAFFLKSEAQALSFAEAASDASREFLKALWIFDQNALSLLSKSRASLSGLKDIPEFPSDSDSAALAWLEGDDEEGIELAMSGLLDLFSESGGSESDTWAAEGIEAEKIAPLKHLAEEAANMELDKARLTSNAIRLSIENSYGSPIKAFRDLGESLVQGYRILSVLDGRIHARLFALQDPGKLVLGYALRALAEGGFFASDYGLGKAKRDMAIDLASPQEKECLMAIQQAFDPASSMSNRFFRAAL
jgi:D-lactate dehydrogenase (cytochrome)